MFKKEKAVCLLPSNNRSMQAHVEHAWRLQVLV